MIARAFCYVAVSFLLAGCSGAAWEAHSVPATGVAAAAPQSQLVEATQPLRELDNLDYSNGAITVFHIANGVATVYKRFTPGHGRAQGIAVDHRGLIYTTVSAPNAKPCLACVQVFTPAGALVAQLAAPTLPSAKNPPSLTDISVDANDNIYVSDYGQQAVYFYPSRHGKWGAPKIVVENSQNAASVSSIPDGGTVLVSGGCGFASVRPYTRLRNGHYQSGACFGIGTIALIGGASDNSLDVLTPVDGAPGLVSVSSPTGGTLFHTPDQRLASISGVAMTGDGSIAYVANHHKESVYAFARPANGWIAGGQPKLLATFTKFKSLDIIAVRP